MSTEKDITTETRFYVRDIYLEDAEHEPVVGWSYKGKSYQPTCIRARWNHGESPKDFTVWGNVIKKDGTPGESQAECKYRINPPDDRYKSYPDAPQWILDLFATPSTTINEESN